MKYVWATILLVILAAIVLIVISGLPKARFGPELNRCYKNHRTVAKGILAYEKQHGHLPPPVFIDEETGFKHSWRVLILPYLGHQQLYDAYRFDEPWNGPNNSLLAASMPDIYCCPDVDTDAGDFRTSYVVVTGPETMWPVDHRRKSSDLGVRPKWTALLCEFSNHRVHWMAPEDVSVGQFIDSNGNCIEKPTSKHRDGAVVVSYANGYTEVVDDMTCDSLRTMLELSSNEEPAVRTEQADE